MPPTPPGALGSLPGQKPHPLARRAPMPDTRRDPRWQPNTCRVKLVDGTTVDAFTLEKDSGGAPRPRFFANGRWWSVPYSEAF